MRVMSARRSITAMQGNVVKASADAAMLSLRKPGHLSRVRDAIRAAVLAAKPTLDRGVRSDPSAKFGDDATTLRESGRALQLIGNGTWL